MDKFRNGKINGTTYTYGDGDGYITAKYTADNVTLPTPTKSRLYI